MNAKSPEQLPQKELVLRFSAATLPHFEYPEWAKARRPGLTEKNEDEVGFDEKNRWAAVLDGVAGQMWK